jgi:hypothetical protein
MSDADPTDPPGQGRGSARPPMPQQRQTGVTDADPQDAPGQGRGGRGPLKPT